MVEVFKTNIAEEAKNYLLTLLQETFPTFRIHFDLEDCDKILRVEGTDFSAEQIIETINVLGYTCEVLE
jgi:hypothetical protein